MPIKSTWDLRQTQFTVLIAELYWRLLSFFWTEFNTMHLVKWVRLYIFWGSMCVWSKDVIVIYIFLQWKKYLKNKFKLEYIDDFQIWLSNICMPIYSCICEYNLLVNEAKCLLFSWDQSFKWGLHNQCSYSSPTMSHNYVPVLFLLNAALLGWMLKPKSVVKRSLFSVWKHTKTERESVWGNEDTQRKYKCVRWHAACWGWELIST